MNNDFFEMDEQAHFSRDIPMDLFEIASAVAAKRVHVNSAVAYREEHPKLSKRAAQILTWWKGQSGQAWFTDRQVKDAIFGTIADMNRVRPRITELIEIGMLRQTGQAKDQLTGKTVRVVGLP